jgi:hypothetical protein
MSGKDKRDEPVAGLRQRAEVAFLEQAGRLPEDLDSLSPDAVRQTLHELRVHQIELEMQNEELRSAQAELDQARATSTSTTLRRWVIAASAKPG